MTTELEKMKLEQEKHMPVTVYVQRITRTYDETSGWSEAWTTNATVKGRIGVMKHSEKLAGGQVQESEGFVITLPASTVVLETDQLQVSGQQYAVKAVLAHTEQTALQVECVRV